MLLLFLRQLFTDTQTPNASPSIQTQRLIGPVLNKLNTFHSILNPFISIQFNIVIAVMPEVGECLLLFGAESSIFQFAIQKVKDQDI